MQKHDLLLNLISMKSGTKTESFALKLNISRWKKAYNSTFTNIQGLIEGESESQSLLHVMLDRVDRTTLQSRLFKGRLN